MSRFDDFNRMFDVNSPVMVFLAKVADLIILSALWFFCSLPVITIGPATAALYYVALKIVRKEEIRVVPTFFKGFRMNFKQGIVINLIFLVLGVIIAADYFIMSHVDEGAMSDVILACFFVMGVWLLCISYWAYPLQAQFVNPIRKTLRNAMLLSTQKFAITVGLFLIHMIPLAVVIADTSLKAFILAAPLWILLAPGVFAYLASRMLVKVFDPLIKPAESEVPEEV